MNRTPYKASIVRQYKSNISQGVYENSKYSPFYFNENLINMPLSNLIQMNNEVKNSFIKDFYDYYDVKHNNMLFMPDPLYGQISREQKEYFDNTVIKFGEVLNEASRLILNFDEIEFSRNFPEHQTKFSLLKIIGHQNVQYARFDFLLDVDGYIKFCETNTHGGSGFSVYSSISKACEPIVQNIKTPDFHDEILFAKELINKSKNIKKIGLFYSGDSPLFNDISPQSIEIIKLGKILKTQFELDITYKDARQIKDDERYDLIFPRTNANKTSMFHHNSTYKNFLLLCRDKNIYSAMNLNGHSFLQDKSLFTFIYKYLDYFEPSSINFIKQHIPYTINLEQTTFDYAIENQVNLILKSKNDARGKNIFLGYEHTRQEWLERISTNLLDNKFILQNRIVINPINIGYYNNDQIKLIQMNNVFASIYLDGKIHGYSERLSQNNIVNVASGGAVRVIGYNEK